MSKENQSQFPSKYMKKLSQEWVSIVDSLQDDEIKHRIVECEKAIIEMEEKEKNDEHLANLKEEVKERKSVYATDEINASIKYLVYVLEGRGK